MGDRLNRRLAKWDAANQDTVRRHNETAGGTWDEFNERHYPGPAWAYVVSNLPFIGGVGWIVIARAWRARRRAAAAQEARLAEASASAIAEQNHREEGLERSGMVKSLEKDDRPR